MQAAPSQLQPQHISSAQVVLPCAELNPTLQFFTQQLGFRVEAIFPADAPTVAVIAGHGLRIRLQPGDPAADPASALSLRLESNDPALINSGISQRLVAPNGTHIELVPAQTRMVLPPLEPAFHHEQMKDSSAWKTGRAGMRYRDLIPDRQGGRVIASHITIPEGGPVPDYVHFHKIRFQMIYCRRGWVKVVYEDQGEPFVLNAGDCVLQPPQIRHRVLESSPGLEVIEIGSPAEHETHADPATSLPTGKLLPQRDYGGQRFVRHQAALAQYSPWRLAGYEYRDIGIAAATYGLTSVHAVRPAKGVATAGTPALNQHQDEMLFFFVLEGRVVLRLDGQEERLAQAGDAITIPPGLAYGLSQPSADLELLEVILHGDGAAAAMQGATA